MYMDANKNKENKKIVKFSDLKVLYGQFSYKYATGIQHTQRVVQYIDMVADVRFRYGKYIFYLNKYPVKCNDGTKRYNVTCSITGFSIVESLTNDITYVRQEICRKLSHEGFSNYERAVQVVCSGTKKMNPLLAEIQPSVLMLI